MGFFKVEFVDAFMIKLAGGPWDREYGVMEYYLPGEYIKHGSNWPAGIPFTNRNTPQVMLYVLQLLLCRHDSRVINF